MFLIVTYIHFKDVVCHVVVLHDVKHVFSHLYFQGQIECNSETVFELAAHVLQATLGDYTE